MLLSILILLMLLTFVCFILMLLSILTHTFSAPAVIVAVAESNGTLFTLNW